MKDIRSMATDAIGGPRSGTRAGRRTWALGVVVACAALAGACSSSSSASTSTTTAVTPTCTRVSATLSDGPDPGADPVGYAQAQVLPLRQIHTSDPRLQSAIDGLAAAYQLVSTSDGAAAATKAASRALAGVDAICPGAGS